MYIFQTFNLTEGGQLVTDLYQAVVNCMARTGVELEVVQARHMYARFVKNNVEMKQAIEKEREDDKRSSSRARVKWNIFDFIISALTGLPTGALTFIQACKQTYSNNRIHCGKNFRIFRDAADQTLPVTEFSEIYN
jgi:hypothetical protein